MLNVRMSQTNVLRASVFLCLSVLNGRMAQSCTYRAAIFLVRFVPQWGRRWNQSQNTADHYCLTTVHQRQRPHFNHSHQLLYRSVNFHVFGLSMSFCAEWQNGAMMLKKFFFKERRSFCVKWQNVTNHIHFLKTSVFLCFFCTEWQNGAIVYRATIFLAWFVPQWGTRWDQSQNTAETTV